MTAIDIRPDAAATPEPQPGSPLASPPSPQSSATAAYRLVRPPARPAVPPDLDADQRAVLAHRGGPLLVLAGPGTGKTTTLVEAVVERITRRGVEPERILLLTFSRRAAAELRERVTARLARTTREPLARTFHSYAFGVLRRHAAMHAAGAPRLLSGPEQDHLIRELLRGDAADDAADDAAGGAVRWPPALRPALLTRGFAQELRDLLLRAIERGVGPAELARLGVELGRDDWPAAARFLRQYLEVTALSGALSGAPAYDPAELIRACVGAFRDDAGLLARERLARRHIFVDEYQDTDPAQEELLELLGTGAEELVVVGDPDQSIYQFRGADQDAIRRFPDRFAPPGRPVSPSIALTSCRRAGPVLLAASRRVAARLTGPAGHRQLVAAAGLPPGRAEAHVFRSSTEEAAYVAHRLRTAHLVDGVAWADMAVIVRSTSRQLGPLRRALLGAGVPVAVAGEDLPLVAQPGVAPLLAVLRCALRDAALDEQSALDLLVSPLGGADVLDLRRLRQELRRLELAGGGSRGSAALVVDALLDPRTLAGVSPEPARAAGRVARLLRVARETNAAAGATAEDVLWAVWSGSGLAERWHRASLRGGPLGAAADRDLDAVVALFDAAARFVDRLPGAGTEAFLGHVEGQQIPGDTLAARTPGGDQVRVLTAHAAKGLEWQVVLVAGVQEGIWPEVRQRGSLLGAEQLVDLLAGRPPGTVSRTAAQLHEERRLFYVAVTRARRSLIVTAVLGDDVQPSRFLDELDPPPPGQARQPTPVPRTLSLPALVAELRAVVTDPAQPELRRQAAAGELARLARAGVPGAHPDQWWGLAPLSDERPLREPAEPVRVSPSRVETFAGCELRWLLETVSGRPASTSQSLGTVVHELAALTADAELATEAELSRRLDAVWGTLDFGAPWFARKERERAQLVLRKFLDWLAASRSTFQLVGVEQEFEVTIGRARLHGRVDRLEHDRDGRLVVVDLKTGRAVPPDEDLARQPQLGSYQLAVTAGGFPGVILEPAAADGCAAEAGPGPASGGAVLVQLGSGHRRAKVQQQPALDDADDPAWARELVLAVADRMAGSAFRATENRRCGSCPVRRSCPVQPEGRQVTE